MHVLAPAIKLKKLENATNNLLTYTDNFEVLGEITAIPDVDLNDFRVIFCR